jgi:hypothetical protein
MEKGDYPVFNRIARRDASAVWLRPVKRAKVRHVKTTVPPKVLANFKATF